MHEGYRDVSMWPGLGRAGKIGVKHGLFGFGGSGVYRPKP